MTITLNTKSREEKKPGVLREEGLVPAEFYGPGIENQHLALDAKEFDTVYGEAGESSLIDLKLVDGTNQPALIGEVSRHPISGDVLHVDLRQVSMTEAMEADVEIEFVGEAVAVKGLGGVLNTAMTTLRVKALPKDLVSTISVDISSLETFENKITIADVKFPAGVEAVDEADAVVATVMEPRVEEEPEVSEEDAVAAVAGEEKKEGEEAKEGEKPAGEKKEEEKK